MKKFLAAIGLSAMMFTALPASAEHLSPPSIGQHRTEIVWSCTPNENQMANLRMYFATGKFQDSDIPVRVWYSTMKGLVSSGECNSINTSYVVREVIESARAPVYDEGQYGEVITFYILRVGQSGTSETFLVATY